MGRYGRKREGSGEMAAAKRRRKTALGESEISNSSPALKTRRAAASAPEKGAPKNSGNSSYVNANSSGGGFDSCCSSSTSSELAEETRIFADLEENSVTVEYTASSSGHLMESRERRDNSPSSEVQLESGEMELTTALPRASDSRRIPTAEKMPTEAELEEFFAAAEKKIQDQFLEKYNYDIVKDKPVDGRYEWIPVELKP